MIRDLGRSPTIRAPTLTKSSKLKHYDCKITTQMCYFSGSQDSEIWLARDCTSFEDLVSEVELGLSKIMFHSV